MIDPKNTLAPYIDGPGLVLSVGSATVLQTGTIYNVPLTIVGLTANATNYVFFNTSGSIQVNTSGFANTVYPIATVVTSNSAVIRFTDNRPDINIGSVGGGVDNFLALSTSQAIVFGGGNVMIDATAGAGGITLTLPTAVGLSGQSARVTMIDTGVGGVTINTTSSQTINGSLTYVLTDQWQTATFESNGANWRVVAAAG